MKHTVFYLLLGLCPFSLHAQTEIGYIEKFALAPDREKVLGELIPGSEDYYFFHALHYQNTSQKEKLDGFMKQWAARYPSSERRKIIENRAALLVYETDPQATLTYLKDHLDLEFEDVQEVRDEKPDLLDTLDQARIDRSAFEKEVLQDDDLSSITEPGLRELIRNKVALTPAQRRSLLSHIGRPDIPGLLPLIIEDLKSEESSGFGEFPIHAALLPDQLNELGKQIKSLVENEAYVNACIAKLAPNQDKDLDLDREARVAWLDRLWNYVKVLPQSFNSLKASVLYQRLQLDRSMGIYDKARFTEYLRLPRSSPYANPGIESRVNNRALVNRDVSYAEVLPGFRPIGDDESLVRDYLLHLLKDEPAWEPWAAWLRESWLKPLFAEAKIINGIGDPEQWASLLSATEFQALRDRVDVDLARDNPPISIPADGVTLKVFVKNAPKLIIKTYEINTLNYFLSNPQPLNTDLTLDGLVANKEETRDLSSNSPFLKTAETFDFPDLKGKRGAWIIEFIGAGKSSRALIRKGNWTILQDLSPGGDLITVLDEAKEPVRNAVAYFEGRKLIANEKTGKILIPFTAEQGSKPIVVSDPTGEFASLATFQHHRESYQLDAQFYIEREQLLAGKEATLAVRADLLSNGKKIPIELLTDTKLTLSVTTHEKVTTTQEIASPALDPKKVFTHKFTVPERTSAIQATLSGKMESLTKGGTKEDLSAGSYLSINGIDNTVAANDTELSRFNQDYIFELLGKNGEPIADQQIEFTFQHANFDNPVTVFLRTNEKGRTNLGTLKEIRAVDAKAPNERQGNWTLDTVARTPSQNIHALAGEEIAIPWNGGGNYRSLLEMRGATFVREIKDGISTTPGFLVIKNLAPGDYSLAADGPDPLAVTISITAGKAVEGWLVSPARELEMNGPKPVQLTSVAQEGDQLVIKVANANPFTRVHVAATRFVPISENTGARGLFNGLGGISNISPGTTRPGFYPNLYSGVRQIGDEYRYILDRRYARRLPGNMLTRPGLLLNPWEVALANIQDNAAGEKGGAATATMGARMAQEGGEMVVDKNPPPPPCEEAGSNIDFLAEAAPVLYNLAPDKDGIVRVSRADLKDRQHIQVYVEDLNSAAWQTLALAEVPTKFRDLRLLKNLDPAKTLTESKAVALLDSGKSLKLEDVSTSDLEVYDTLSGIYRLFTAINPEDKLAKFEWILRWPKLDEKDRAKKYSEFACHELNFFLAQKDKPFFEKVILPYLKNKKDKTFMDHYLIGDDLSHYLQSWEYAQLNVAERCLLARRVPNASAARLIREQWELQEPDLEKEDLLFETALRGGALAEGESRSDFQAQKATVAESAPPPPAQSEAAAAYADGPVPKPQAAAAPKNGEAKDKRKEAFKRDEAEFAEADADVQFKGMDIAAAKALREDVRPFYRRLGPTKVWAENNYYNLTLDAQGPGMIEINKFWRDYAAWDGKSPFLSANVAEASETFSEMMLALAILDLPFEAEKPKSAAEANSYTLTAATPLIAYHKQITPAAVSKEAGSLLVSQNFFQEDDRTRQVGNEEVDRYITDEFLVGTVYGANIVVTNPTSSTQKVEMLLQIPHGAMPVKGTKSTDSGRVELEPYSTQAAEYFFYFPAAGTNGKKFPQYPVHISKGNEVIGEAKPFEFNVVGKLTQIDQTSWEYVSQYATDAEVFTFLEKNNLQRLALGKIAWRCRKSQDFFKKLIDFMNREHLYDNDIFRYGVHYNDRAVISQWLQHQDGFIAELGSWLSTKVLEIDPIKRRKYEHLEYWPLINQRTLRFGAENRIANPVILKQYQELLQILSYKAALDPMDNLSVVYYLFLQDRAAEALDRFQQVNAESIPSKVQLDYFRCYVAFYEGKPEEARQIASAYAGHAVNRWKDKFAEVIAQADEIQGKQVARPKGPESGRESQQEQLSSTEPSFEFKTVNQSISLTWSNLKEVTINYYLLDPEFSFSANPFVTQETKQFSIIKPNKTGSLSLPEGKSQVEIPIPPELVKADLLVEVLGAGQRKTQGYHANTMRINLAENYGLAEVREQATGKALPAVYVKVYARLDNGQIRFYKDGYTDLRGKFDYASLNTGMESIQPPVPLKEGEGGLDHPTLAPSEIGSVEKLAVLILSDGNGAEVREVNPPSE